MPLHTFRLALLATAVVICGNTALADLLVVDAHSTGLITNLAEADALLGGTGVASETTVLANFIDYFDNGGAGLTGNFGNNLSFPNDNLGVDDENFAIRATGEVFIPTAGDWTFGVSSDDGSRLIIGGSTVILDDSLHGVQDAFGTTTLSVGWHALDFVFFEHTGGASVELFASEGTFTSFLGNDFQLVGDTANGGLLTQTTPEPGSLTLMGLAAIAGLSRRRRPTQLHRNRS